MRFIATAIPAATLVLGAACAAVEPAAPASPSLATIEALIGDAACDGDAQCHTVGIGAKACGGPQAYLAWSSKRTDAAALQAAASRHAAAARAAAEASGIQSTCSVTPDPGAYCASGAPGASTPAGATAKRCRLRGNARGANVY